MTTEELLAYLDKEDGCGEQTSDTPKKSLLDQYSSLRHVYTSAFSPNTNASPTKSHTIHSSPTATKNYRGIKHSLQRLKEIRSRLITLESQLCSFSNDHIPTAPLIVATPKTRSHGESQQIRVIPLSSVDDSVESIHKTLNELTKDLLDSEDEGISHISTRKPALEIFPSPEYVPHVPHTPSVHDVSSAISYDSTVEANTVAKSGTSESSSNTDTIVIVPSNISNSPVTDLSPELNSKFAHLANTNVSNPFENNDTVIVSPLMPMNDPITTDNQIANMIHDNTNTDTVIIDDVDEPNVSKSLFNESQIKKDVEAALAEIEVLCAMDILQ
ncbi:hypothetical protein PCE1_001616 [Barthelona sp. PCE]